MLSINGITLGDEALEREAKLFVDARDRGAAARRSLAVRELLLQRAGALGLLEGGAPRAQVCFASRADEDAVIAAVIEADIRVPSPTEEECRRYYDSHPERHAAGELIEARHILFAVTKGTPVNALRDVAERALSEILADSTLFAERARDLSNCPSGAQGGNLGQFGRGQMAPEFEQALFGKSDVGVLPQLVRTRFGFHVVEVVRRIPGRAIPYDEVRGSIADRLTARSEERALAQYVRVLAGSARIEGVDLGAASSPLVQ
ncbi:MAG TPA: peptidylprolyl isomerase [Casimicrobiaceae bacterium]|nr:peptidylprolyl isomerase [Casimicrobiaceae bacterium]